MKYSAKKYSRILICILGSILAKKKMLPAMTTLLTQTPAMTTLQAMILKAMKRQAMATKSFKNSNLTLKKR
jgi:hypothetical protein